MVLPEPPWPATLTICTLQGWPALSRLLAVKKNLLYPSPAPFPGCSARGFEPLPARGEAQGPLAPHSRHQHPHWPHWPPAVRWGQPQRPWKHFLADLRWNRPQDRAHGRPGKAKRDSGFRSFLPQLVTQGSYVHGLSNKLTVELKSICFYVSSMSLPYLHYVACKILAVTRNEAGPIS